MSIHEECGVFGVISPKPVDVANISYYGLYALQHRGQESCGIVVNDDGVFVSHKDLGLVGDVFSNDILSSLPSGTMAVGHVRYGTTGGTNRNNCQPIEVNHQKGRMALAHNGNLSNAAKLRNELELSGAIFHTTSDTETIAYIVTRERLNAPSIEDALSRAMNTLDGAYSLVLMSPQKLICARDPYGFRPLCYGQTPDGTYIVASESCAIKAVGGEVIRDVEPGEILVFSKHGVVSRKEHCNQKEKRLCIFEYIYFARPDSVIDGISVHASRVLAGKILAQTHPIDADIVIGAPDSGLDPVLVRPSFVLGGRAMQIVAKEEALRNYLKTAVEINEEKPVLVDKYIRGKEVEVDAVCDGKNVFVPGIMELVERTGVHSGDSISIYPTHSISEKVKETILDYTQKLGLGIGIIGLFNIQFIVDEFENVYIIEVNPRSSRTVPFLSKATGYSLADIATLAILGKSLPEQGIHTLYPKEKERFYVKAPAFSFSKLHGMDAYLSPEMKSTGEAIGYDNKLHRAMYKAMIASGIKVQNYGTVVVTLADEDKEEALPLVRRFYDMGFNIEATVGTALFLKEQGIRTRILRKPSEGSEEVLDSIRAGYVSYVICTRAILSGIHYEDGVAIRRCASENNITMLTSLDTVRVLLDVLEEVTIGISTI